MSLKTIGGDVIAGYSLKRAIKQRSVGHRQVFGKRFLRHGKPVILTGHHDRAICQILYRVIGTVVPELHLLGGGAAGQCENLMAQANTK